MRRSSRWIVVAVALASTPGTGEAQGFRGWTSTSAFGFVMSIRRSMLSGFWKRNSKPSFSSDVSETLMRAGCRLSSASQA